VHGLKMALRLAFEDYTDSHIFDPPGATCRCGDRYRIIEQFLTRPRRAWDIGAASAPSDPLFVPAGGDWQPSYGAAALNARYFTPTGLAIFEFTPLPDAIAEAARLAFSQRELGFVPSDPTEEIAAWQAYAQSHGATTTPLTLPDGEVLSAEITRL